MNMTQREIVITYLEKLLVNNPVLITHIYKELSDMKKSSVSSIITILCKTKYFRRGVGIGGPYIIKIKSGSVENILNAFRKTDVYLYEGGKGRGRIKKG